MCPFDCGYGSVMSRSAESGSPRARVTAEDLHLAVQLAPTTPPLDGEVPFRWESRRAGGPANADRAAGPDGLLQVLEASGALLVSMVRTTPPRTRAYHVFGISDPDGAASSRSAPAGCFGE